MTAVVDHTRDLNRALFAVLTHHDADTIRFTTSGILHTADAQRGKEHFEATAPTSVEALDLAMTGLKAATGGA